MLPVTDFRKMFPSFGTPGATVSPADTGPVANEPPLTNVTSPLVVDKVPSVLTLLPDWSRTIAPTPPVTLSELLVMAPD